ncbi:helix-turn-helix domain-containing protein [Solidesulfovibrio magneticus]|uniref:Xre family DNA-binding protein n=1 Tax=Solidesulfovibrio magneticus (strain ATCC 700980 / DSM 13731 / RS-1) TaxID=573370 RepID=C4XTY7_SOLM1|nr:helix-turn-helix domain-containing protein [Solidesulfovibrio magneticus]BAH73652.1 Xre family DNA-binding protein [Solidesulfovibrio magneticus RS-1]
MNKLAVEPAEPRTVGDLIRFWRNTKKISQMDLALEVDVSTRHLSFVETGKSRPSRKLVFKIAESLKMPFRHRNALLALAGYSSEFAEESFNGEGMGIVRQALQRFLSAHDPYPAFVIDGEYNILMKNFGYERMAKSIIGEDAFSRHNNAYLLTFSCDGFCNHIESWPAVGRFMLDRLMNEAIMTKNSKVYSLYQQCLSMFSDVEEGAEQQVADLPVLSITLKCDGMLCKFFTLITTLGTPLDSTSQELRIESLCPADEATKKMFLPEGIRD